MNNLFSNLPADLADELVDVLAENRGVRIERIVSTGQTTPTDFWYDQADDEWVAVLKGSAELRFEGGEQAVRLGPGDHLLIPAHQRHQVAWTAPDEVTVWVAVFFPATGRAR